MRFIELSMRYALAAAVSATSLNAQQDPIDANLREIATSLWLSFNLDTATFALGNASAGFPQILLPRGTNVLGSIDKGTGQSTTLILLPFSFAVSVDSLRFRFLIGGWRPIEERSPQPGAGRGGSPPQGGRGNAPMLPTYRCQNGDSLQSSWVRTLGTGTVVMLKHFRSASAGPCAMATDLPLTDSSGNLSAATGAEAIHGQRTRRPSVGISRDSDSRLFDESQFGNGVKIRNCLVDAPEPRRDQKHDARAIDQPPARMRRTMRNSILQ